jgi:pimeloyl-ACP methyl ester carboxylesterase
MGLKKFFSKLSRYLLLPLLALLVLLTAVCSGYFAYQRRVTARNIAIISPTGIQTLEQVILGGVKQWISIRGLDRDNPVLLFLHGGPGFPEMVPVRHYNRELEEHFVVVNWDQRGAGKSYSPDIDLDMMNLDQFVEDTLELTRLLRERFDTEQIYLVGHSWGSILGVHAARLHPEYYYAYAGIGQAVNFVQAEQISYQFTLDRARELNIEAAISELEEIGSPPYGREQLGIQRKWLFQFGGEVYGETSNARYLLRLLGLHLSAPEYTLTDVINLIRGNNFSGLHLWDQLMAVNLPQQAPELQLPVYFLTGRYDYVTVFEKVEEYYQLLEAPRKELVWFAQSAHSPNFEQPAEFAAVMKRIKDETYR